MPHIRFHETPSFVCQLPQLNTGFTLKRMSRIGWDIPTSKMARKIFTDTLDVGRKMGMAV